MTQENLTIVNEINNKFKIGRIWKEKRLYINGLYDTKKCKQNAYIDLETFKVVCFTECPSQPVEWCQSQNEVVVERFQVHARLIRIATKGQKLATEPVEVVMNNAVLEAEEVKGYTTQWREVRVPINRFGKLATRNRQFVVAFKGTKANAPRGLVLLSDAAYDILANKRNGEEMLEPYNQAPDYEAIAQRVSQGN